MAKKVSGVEPGQRQLNGTQTTGRDYKDLSTPEYEMTHDFDVEAPMRDASISWPMSTARTPRASSQS
jgi:uncharacterized protein